MREILRIKLQKYPICNVSSNIPPIKRNKPRERERAEALNSYLTDTKLPTSKSMASDIIILSNIIMINQLRGMDTPKSLACSCRTCVTQTR